MEIRVETIANAHVVRLKGRLDTHAVPHFQGTTLELIEQGARKIIISCRELQYISSAGIRALYILRRELQPSQGKVVLSEPDPTVRNILDIVDFSSEIRILASFEEALEFFRD